MPSQPDGHCALIAALRGLAILSSFVADGTQTPILDQPVSDMAIPAILR